MIKRNIYRTCTTPLICAVALTLFYSCQVDERYSFEKIEHVDTNLTLFENGLSIPLIDQTARITADSLITLSGLDTTAFGNYLKVSPEGNYFLDYNKEYDLNEPIKELDLKHLIDLNEITRSYDLSYDINQDISISGANTRTNSISKAVINIDNQLNFTLLEASDIPEMVKKIGAVTLKDTKAVLNLKFNNLPDIENSTYRISIKAQLPDFIKPSVLNIEGELDNQGSFKKTFTIDGFDLSSYDLAQMREDGKNIEIQIDLSGKITANNVTLSTDDLKNKISAVATVTLTGPSNKISIKEVDAYINYSIDSLLRVPFFTIPQTLKDFTLDLPEATLSLFLSSNMSIPADANIDFNKGMYTFPIMVPYSEGPDEFISKENDFELNLNPLISSQTDTIDVKFNLNTDPKKMSHIDMDATYALKASVGLQVPLQLGENLAMTYADTISLDDSADLLKDILKKTVIQLHGDVENTLPFEVAVKMDLLSYDPQNDTYNIIPTEDPIESVLAQANGNHSFAIVLKTAPEAQLQNLSHLRFSIQIGADGAVLNKENYISISGIGITIPEGISLDFKELTENEEE